MTSHEISKLFDEVVSIFVRIDRLETLEMTAKKDVPYMYGAEMDSLWSRLNEIKGELAKDDIILVRDNGSVQFLRTIHHRFIG